jgi:quinol monooxygenase YgiN
MDDGRIALTVVISAVAGREDELAGQLKALLQPTRSEEGCVDYRLHTSAEQPGTFLFYEVFANQAALDAHINTPHFKAFLKHRENSEPVANQTVMRWNIAG